MLHARAGAQATHDDDRAPVRGLARHPLACVLAGGRGSRPKQGADRRGIAIGAPVSHGCIVSGGEVRCSLLFTNVRVDAYRQICEVAVLPDVVIGRHARPSRVVIDGEVRIPERLVVSEDPELDARRFSRSGGDVTLMTQSMVDALD